MAATDSQIALTMTFTLRPPFKTHFLLLKDYVADVRIPARDGVLTTIIAKKHSVDPGAGTTQNDFRRRAKPRILAITRPSGTGILQRPF